MNQEKKVSITLLVGLNRSKMIAKFCLMPVNWLKRLVNGF